MNDEEALITACLAEPKDNTRRLVLADWWDEYGVTESQHAHAEWIRLTCTKNRLSTLMRVPGERDWIMHNFHRLWPHLFERVQREVYASDKGKNLPFYRLQMPMGRYVFSVPTLTRDKNPTVTRVVMCGSRGIVESIQVAYFRACDVAPLLAADESHAELVMVLVNSYTSGLLYPSGLEQATFVWDDFYQHWGISAVWEGLEGWNREVIEPPSRKARVFTSSVESGTHHESAVRSINASLTRWARQKAKGQEKLIAKVRYEFDEFFDGN